ncbi:LacI family DNA-binding transcriptional regulator [Sphaerotilus sp.]|uniref:LacI family DNA-binding transcriptional regulator n=1 Tax=Sphaerotilus sp. TaxID=2093942 RepID=UPI002ACECC84|nr:LacI family DNA-binding transcriptional regulator [Sphaerotilus sp.]MDZ7857959.1 LacI family DNA-binding transcriptional regulator [Sphaerotilus sp.]
MSTIKDVARLAGVGVATASRALSGNGSVSEDTAQRVRQAATALDYRPSITARALSLQQSSAIGVYVPGFDGHFYSGIVATIDGVLRTVGRHMIAANGCGTGSTRQLDLDGIDFLIGRDCDGLIVASNSLDDDDLERLMARVPNLVAVNRALAAHRDNSFCADHRAGGRLAARALLARGHRTIATVRGPRDTPDNEARLNGFRDELAHHGVAIRPEHSADGAFDLRSGDAAAQQLLAAAPGQRPAFTAVFVANDVMALAVISRLARTGLRVPEDVSVLGYDDDDFAPYTSPALTTIRIPTASVATNACRHVLNLCYGLDLPVVRDFPPEVVWRASVGPGPHPPMELP